MVASYKEMYENAMDKVKEQRVQLKKQKESIEDIGYSLMSSSLEVGKYADHIVEFENGQQKTFKEIDNTTINVGKFTKMKNKSGVMIGIAQDKVVWYEVHKCDIV